MHYGITGGNDELFLTIPKKGLFFALKYINNYMTIISLFSYMHFLFFKSIFPINSRIQKQPSRGVHRKRCSENMQQIYWRTPMPKCDFNKVALQIY